MAVESRGVGEEKIQIRIVSFDFAFESLLEFSRRHCWVRLEILVRTHPGLAQGTSRIRICRGGKDVDMGLSLSISSSRATRSSLVATAGCASKFW